MMKTNGTIFHSFLYLNSRRVSSRLKYVYSVMSVKITTCQYLNVGNRPVGGQADYHSSILWQRCTHFLVGFGSGLSDMRKEKKEEFGPEFTLYVAVECLIVSVEPRYSHSPREVLASSQTCGGGSGGKGSCSKPQ